MPLVADIGQQRVGPRLSTRTSDMSVAQLSPNVPLLNLIIVQPAIIDPSPSRSTYPCWPSKGRAASLKPPAAETRGGGAVRGPVLTTVARGINETRPHISSLRARALRRRAKRWPCASHQAGRSRKDRSELTGDAQHVDAHGAWPGPLWQGSENRSERAKLVEVGPRPRISPPHWNTQAGQESSRNSSVVPVNV